MGGGWYLVHDGKGLGNVYYVIENPHRHTSTKWLCLIFKKHSWCDFPVASVCNTLISSLCALPGSI